MKIVRFEGPSPLFNKLDRKSKDLFRHPRGRALPSRSPLLPIAPSTSHALSAAGFVPCGGWKKGQKKQADGLRSGRNRGLIGGGMEMNTCVEQDVLISLYACLDMP